MKNNEKGFSALELILVIVVVVLLGALGFMVYKNQNKAEEPAKTATKSVSTAPRKKSVPAPPAQESAPFVNVIQDDSSIMQLIPEKIAKTSDQAAILTALHKTCTSGDSYVTVNHAVFDGKPNFTQEGNYAEINATACSPLAKTIDDLGGSGAANYLHKNSSGVWVFDTASQMTPSCARVDGLGYPSSIISVCYDGSTSRAPR